ncbi:MAG: hypothetical protein ACXAEX_20790 [Promethearchaeota archaeon]
MKIIKSLEPQFVEDLKLNEVLKRIENTLGNDIVDYEELNFWRQIRNEIVHEHKKVTIETMEKAKNFFTKLYDALIEISNKALE